jgi:omega-6 fatty acid desaturase (delta-12 desaturase)
LLGIAPLYYFLWLNSNPSPGRRRSIFLLICSNLAIVAIVVTTRLTIGFRMSPGSVAGADRGSDVWLFYNQQQFEVFFGYATTHGTRGGSSRKDCQLPKLFQWAHGNIGFHHIHNMHPGIPN